MRHSAFAHLSRLCLAGIMSLSGLSAHAVGWYQAQVIATPSGAGFADAYALNDEGWVVGYGNFTGNNEAFLWRDGVMQPLGRLPGAYTSGGSGINQSGQVAGSSSTQPFLWQGGVMQPLPGGTSYAHANAINNAGTVVGDADGRAVIWQNGQMQTLPKLPTLSGSIAIDISETGVVVGSGYTSQYTSQAWRWSNGQLTQLSSGSARGAGATSVNDLGNAAGFVELGGNLDQAARWDSDALILLDQLAGTNSARAYGINNSGIVVGSSFAGGGSQATLWEGSSAVDLTQRLTNGQGWDLWQAMDINGHGQIVGWGTYEGRYVSYLLTPVPEANGMLMLAIGLPFIWLLRARQSRSAVQPHR